MTSFSPCRLLRGVFWRALLLAFLGLLLHTLSSCSGSSSDGDLDLAFVVQPSGATAGEPISPPVEVALKDSAGTTLTQTSALVTIGLGAGGPGGSLSGTLSEVTVDGVATFDDLSIDLAANGHTLTATGVGFSTADSLAFTVSPGTAVTAAFSVEPSAVGGGEVIAPAVEVTLRDAHGNVATTSTTPVTIGLDGSPVSACLTGTLTAVPSAGVATFADLVVHGPGSVYGLRATGSGLSDAASQGFTVTGVTLPAASGDLAAFVEGELLSSIPFVSGSGSGANPAEQKNQYVLPTATQLATWRSVFQKMLAADVGGAHTLARTISQTYNVVEYLDTVSGDLHYVLMEGLPGAIPAPVDHPFAVSITDPSDPTRRGWGTYVFNSFPSTPVSFSSPHPKDDLETGHEGIEAYVATDGHSWLLAGADRDQNVALARCDQSSRPYLEADMAHNAESVFQIAFEEIHDFDPSLVHIQFHGNATCVEDVFISNGVSTPPPALDALKANIDATSLAWAGGGPMLATDVYDDSGDCTLRGTKNTQLRYAAGFTHAEVCDAVTPTVSSTFVHVESLRIARRALADPLATAGQNRQVVIEAIRLTF